MDGDTTGQTTGFRDERFGSKPAIVRRPSLVTTVLVLAGAVTLGVTLTQVSVDAPFREIAVILGATVLVGGGLNHLLVSGDELPPVVAESVYLAHVSTVEATIVDHAGTPVYVPVGGHRSAKLVVPESAASPLEHDWDGEGDIGDGDATFTPSGEALYRHFRRLHIARESDSGNLSQFADALESGLELLDGVSASVSEGRGTVRFDACSLPGVGRIDHPVQSFLAVALARQFGRPVVVRTADVNPDGSGVIELEW